MSDKDHAQMNAIKSVHPKSTILLCWWHVLHAWQQHFVVTAFLELWKLLKDWVRITDEGEFWKQWEEIKKIAPPSVLEYLKTYWLGEIKLWSAVYRSNHNIFQLCDTNMLVEAWHHVLKGTFMQGKQNRCLDQLIFVLVDQAIPHFISKHRHQDFGFKGPDLEIKKRLEIEERAKLIKCEDITVTDEPDIYEVKSTSNPNLIYRIDLDAYDCSCLAFPTICFCKHLGAVQIHFPEIHKMVPTSFLAIQADDSIQPNGGINLIQPELSTPKSTIEMSNLIHKLSTLAISLQSHPALPTASLTDFSQVVDNLIAEIGCIEKPLPRPKKLAPNQHSWTETAAVMNAAVKSKRKKHTDPYGGGERSGKRSQVDVCESVIEKPATSAMLEKESEEMDLPANPEIALPAPTFPIFPMILGNPNTSSAGGAVGQPPLSAIVHQPNTNQPQIHIPKSSLLPSMFSLSTPVQAFANCSQIPLRHVDSETFNPATVDTRDLVLLQSFKRKQLNENCFHHRISAGGKSQDVIDRLLRLRS